MDTLVSLGYWGLFIGSFLAATVIPITLNQRSIQSQRPSHPIQYEVNPPSQLPTVAIAKHPHTFPPNVNTPTNNTSALIGIDWIERWFKVKREKLEQQKGHVDRYGVWLALFTWLPIVGDLFAIALGFYRVRPKMSAFYMLVGRFSLIFRKRGGGGYSPGHTSGRGGFFIFPMGTRNRRKWPLLLFLFRIWV